MLPVLRSVEAGSRPVRELVSAISDEFHLTDEERSALVPSGGRPLINDRVHWATVGLERAKLITKPERGIVAITHRGRELLATTPALIDRKLLMRYPEYQEYHNRARRPGCHVEPEAGHLAPNDDGSAASPEERIDAAAAEINVELRTTLLAKVLEATPDFFERLVIDLLLAMGYGGSRVEAGEKLGRTGDGGVDGVIREDRLGLDLIYLQAKRYQEQNSIGADTVRSFAGALNDFGAQKGIIITTSRFTKEAIAYADRQQMKRLVLVDGERLTDLMIRFGVGVRLRRAVEIKSIDLDYFEEAELT